MDYKKVEKKVIFFEEHILNNFEEHFSDLILDDFYGGGHKERISDSWFYDEYFEQYEQDIVDLLLKLENEGDEFYELQLRLIKLKRIIDSTLLKISIGSNQSPPSRLGRPNHFKLKGNINKQMFVETLYSELHSNELIKCSLKEFDFLFLESKERQKVQWLGTEFEITLLINSIMHHFSKDVVRQYFKVIELNFRNRFGNDFKANQLSSVYHSNIDDVSKTDPLLSISANISKNI